MNKEIRYQLKKGLMKFLKHNYSYREINKILKDIFGTGLSFHLYTENIEVELPKVIQLLNDLKDDIELDITSLNIHKKAINTVISDLQEELNK